MIRINSVSRITYRLLQTRIAHQISIRDSWLDPNKHITMGKYFHYMYRDSYDIGEYPEQITIGSIPPRTYQPLVEEGFLELIKNRYVDRYLC